MGLHKAYLGCVGDDSKEGKGMDLGDLGRNRHGEMEG